MNGTERSKVNLSCLPTELLQYVANLLPLSSAASFALCSRSILHIVGTGYWKSLRELDQQSEESIFLNYLEKDLCDYVLCYHCEQLHRRSAVERPQEPYLWGLEKSFACTDKEGVMTIFAAGYVLRYRHVRLAMNGHRYGLSHGIPLEVLSRNYKETIDGSTLHTSILARIVADELLLRVRYRFVSLSERELKAVRMHFFDVCPHLSAYHEGNALTRLVRCRLSHEDTRHFCSSCCVQRDCSCCATSFSLELEDSSDGGVLFIVTVWKNLGFGRTPFDPMWWRHVSKLGNNLVEHTPFKHVPYDIQAAFEQQLDRPRT